MGRTYRGSAEIRFRGEGKEKKPVGRNRPAGVGSSHFLASESDGRTDFDHVEAVFVNRAVQSDYFTEQFAFGRGQERLKMFFGEHRKAFLVHSWIGSCLHLDLHEFTGKGYNVGSGVGFINSYKRRKKYPVRVTEIPWDCFAPEASPKPIQTPRIEGLKKGSHPRGEDGFLRHNLGNKPKAVDGFNFCPKTVWWSSHLHRWPPRLGSRRRRWRFVPRWGRRI